MKLHKYGTPSHRLERVLSKVAESLGIHGEFFYTPTALVISLTEPSGDEMTVVRRVTAGAFDVDKLIRFDQLLGQVEGGEIVLGKAINQLAEIDNASHLYSQPVYAVACSVACMCVAVFFGGSMAEVCIAGVIGAVVAGLELLHERQQWEHGLLEPLAGVVAAIGSILVARYLFPIDDRLTTLAGLIVLIPGLRLTVALTELAVGHLSAGTARLAGAMVCLATLFVGVALVWRMARVLRPVIELPSDSANHWRWIALAVAPIAFAIVFRAGYKQWPIIAMVSILGVVVSWAIEPKLGVEVASFFGALAIGCSSNLYARVRNVPAMVPQTPGMLILVPGSLGYRSFSALLEQHTVQGVQYGFTMILIAVSLVGGLLVSNAIVSPRRIL
ncbi:hypothetical protein K239x_56620 [Planctomycetes bacterium K23_9]|uniref:Threonine/serine exporter-like N-terminal domain-containing protein n=2 Tax=Stieleria marina TaxID=1930275 RepID=A0A517P2N5_9BACT|nr:hypothetical protein K239x_56620 [Planctomycetes bacterium K23_9]